MGTRREFLGGCLVGAVATALGGCCFARKDQRRRFALNASTLKGYGLTLEGQVCAAIAGGFGGFEPWLKDVHAARAAGRLGEVIRRARGEGLSFVNGIAFGTWSHPDAAVRAAGLEETKRDMAALAEMGCPCIAASLFGVHKPGSPRVTLAEIAERYAAVLALGAQMGVTPLLEYWGHSVVMNRAEDALEVLRLAGRSEAPILADVYHTYRGGGSFETFARLGGGRLPVLHVNDYPAIPARAALVDADRVWPGDGIAPWGSIFAALRTAGADPWLSIEVFNPAYWKATPEKTATEGMRRIARVKSEE